WNSRDVAAAAVVRGVARALHHPELLLERHLLEKPTHARREVRDFLRRRGARNEAGQCGEESWLEHHGKHADPIARPPTFERATGPSRGYSACSYHSLLKRRPYSRGLPNWKFQMSSGPAARK